MLRLDRAVQGRGRQGAYGDGWSRLRGTGERQPQRKDSGNGRHSQDDGNPAGQHAAGEHGQVDHDQHGQSDRRDGELAQ